MEATTPAERTLTQIDCARLTRLLARQDAASMGAASMQELLDTSDLVASAAVAPDVVTMYTQVLLQGAAAGEPPYKIALCYPEHAEPAAGFISVLSPLGTALLGLQVGDVARWQPPAGDARAARVVAVLFQPEASGDYLT